MRRPAVCAVAVALVVAGCGGASTPSTVTTPSTVALPSTTVPSTTAPEEVLTTTTLAPGEPVPTTLPWADTALRLEPVADGFEQPVFYTTVSGRGFVVDQPGVIWATEPGVDPEVFLDIRKRVKFGGEQGLLGLAFHPDHPELLYVDYTAKNNDTVVAEFTIEGRVADPNSERKILEIPQPAKNHNGGMIAFGPTGDLWIGMGDGGGANDRYGNGQRDDTLLGAMLRIKVGPEIETYKTPPFFDFAAREIWGIGLRNPWRFSFDFDTESIWIADVGQGDVEEVNRNEIEDLGLNFGWPLYEGTDCLAGPCDGVDASLRVLTFPVYEYRHDEGCSITGGYVYRGDAIPQLDGHYFFSDWCSGFIRSIAPDGTMHDWTDRTGNVAAVTSFGRDDSGEIYVVSGAGTIYRIVEDQG